MEPKDRDRLARLVRVVSMNDYTTMLPRSARGGDIVLHLAQDNTRRVNDKRPATLYLAKKYQDLPETV